MTRPTGTYEPVSERIAKLRMSRADAPFGITTGKYLLHRLGLREAPLYDIQQPLAPSDDMWSFRQAPGGRFLHDSDGVAPEIERSVANWAARSAATKGFALCGLLPAGEYFLVRTALRPRVSAVLVGNGRDRAPNLVELLDDPKFFVCAVGPRDNVAPDLAQPLLGIPILRYTTATLPVGIVCLPFADALLPGGYDGRDLILVIPAGGEFVLDALGPVPPDKERRNLKPWTDEFVHEFVQLAAHHAPDAARA